MKVSVVVAVYNPGRHLDAPVGSFLRQTLPREEFEVVFVDDGSTDGSGRRLDRLARRHPNFRVIHIPNSGWPGRPRNLGTDAATGRYVLFVDHDDWLEDDALAYLWQTAEANGADVVAAREIGHGFGVPRRMFRRSIPDARLGRDDILALLTPHKLFRRQMLVDHDIRFPEGPRRLEDHHFVIQAYFHARRITVTGDHPVYHWAKREKGTNATKLSFARSLYYDNLRDIVDIVDAHTDPGDFRDRLYAHWLRYKMIHKLLRPRFRAPGPDSRTLYAEIRRLMDERFSPAVDRHLPVGYRLVARAVRADRLDHVVAAAAYANGLRLDAAVRGWQAGSPTRIDVEWALRGPSGDPLRLVRTDPGRLSWDAPKDLVEGLILEPDDLDVTDELAATELSLVLRQRGTDLDHDAPLPIPPRELDGGAELAGMTALPLDVDAFAAGSPLPDGTWDALVQAEFGGFRAQRRLDASGARLPAESGGVKPYATAKGTLAVQAARGVPSIRPLDRLSALSDGEALAALRRALPRPAKRLARRVLAGLRSRPG